MIGMDAGRRPRTRVPRQRPWAGRAALAVLGAIAGVAGLAGCQPSSPSAAPPPPALSAPVPWTPRTLPAAAGTGDLASAIPSLEPALEPAPQAAPAVERSPATGTGVWAVLVGIDDYPGRSSDLPGAVADMAEVERALDLAGVPATHRVVLTDRAASADAVREAAAWLVANAGPDAVAVWAFAGHTELTGGQQVMVTSDDRQVADTELAQLRAPLAARRAWLLFATCFGGGFDEALAPGRILTAAAGPRQVAYQNPSVGGSYLVHEMIRRGWLEGRAGPSVQEAFAFASAELRREYGRYQPYVVDRTTGPLVLGPLGTASGAPAAASSSSPPPSSAPPTTTTSAPPPPPTTTTTTRSRCSDLGLVTSCASE